MIEFADIGKIIEPEIQGDLYFIPLAKTGCHLAIYRRELMANLPDELLMKCLERGKAIKRRRAFEKRAKERNDCDRVEL